MRRREGHLVVAYNFAPFVDASAVTVVKRIAHAAREVHVVSKDLTGYRPVDPGLAELVAPWVKRHDVLAGRPRFVEWASIADFAARGVRRLRAQGGTSSFATMYSRSMWPHSHVLAALLRVEDPELRWTAEFSDPLLRRVDGGPRRSPGLTSDALTRTLMGAMGRRAQEFVERRPEVLHLVQALPFALADELVFTNVQQRETMLEDLHDDEFAEHVLQVSSISPHPVPPAGWYGAPASHVTAPGPTTIGYFGTLYPNRGLGAMVEAVQALTPPDRRRLRIDVYTDNWDVVVPVLRRTPVSATFRVRPALPYREFLAALSSYDHLAVMDTFGGAFSVANPFLPSKLSDYLGSGRNILSITAPGSELDKRGYFPTARIGDVRGLRDALVQAVRKEPAPSL